MLIYGSETWCLTHREEQSLSVFEQGIMRKVFSGILEDDVWRQRTNVELKQLLDDAPNIRRFLKMKRLRWMDKLSGWRSEYPEDYSRDVLGTRKLGRPPVRWMLWWMRSAELEGGAKNKTKWWQMVIKGKACNMLVPNKEEKGVMKLSSASYHLYLLLIITLSSTKMATIKVRFNLLCKP